MKSATAACVSAGVPESTTRFSATNPSRAQAGATT